MQAMLKDHYEVRFISILNKKILDNAFDQMLWTPLACSQSLRFQRLPSNEKNNPKQPAAPPSTWQVA
jgi:hypothetical protein